MNNLEQGFLLAFAGAGALSLLWLAIIFSSACLRQINIEHQLRRIADVLENPVVDINQAVDYYPAGEPIRAGDPVVLRDGRVYRA